MAIGRSTISRCVKVMNLQIRFTVGSRRMQSSHKLHTLKTIGNGMAAWSLAVAHVTAQTWHAGLENTQTTEQTKILQDTQRFDLLLEYDGHYFEDGLRGLNSLQFLSSTEAEVLVRGHRNRNMISKHALKFSEKVFMSCQVDVGSNWRQKKDSWTKIMQILMAWVILANCIEWHVRGTLLWMVCLIRNCQANSIGANS